MLFTVFGVAYWYTRKLWPLVFAHMLLDIGSVSAIKLLAG
jgi:membrane protease YdiL (CAAX protease family)